ncbi:universal stress protein [Nitrospira sp. KM1]|uniref:universal stress protein n=1 Tax=Nitrospira sp. KM1 TaxID=1936990 RepID=UPI0013A7632E|nr:universal stress protein [Nitrospira sp. KM1]BCA56273.1 universal stress protein [Nitrospira sp. KM1]
MSDHIMLSPLGFHRIFHPTDFSQESEVAFAHALKLALVARTEFTIMHTEANKEDLDLQEFPQVRATLQRWKTPDDVGTGLKVKKVAAVAKSPSQGIIEYLAHHPTGLVVLSTSQRDGLARWSRDSVAEPLARAANRRTLFIPAATGGFVSQEDGSVSLRSILIPVAKSPDPQEAVNAAALLAKAMNIEHIVFHFLHVGPSEQCPTPATPKQPGWAWNTIVTDGDIVERIHEQSAACQADLIVMVTEGHKTFSSMLGGSTTEHVVRGASCPVLALPAIAADAAEA